MEKGVQQRLPKFQVERVIKPRKIPQPKPSKLSSVKKFEILHRPFDLAFRGKVNRWLNNLQTKGVKIHQILDRKSYLIIKYYFFPVSGIWLTQKQVAEKVKYIMEYKIRSILVESLVVIWEKSGR